MSSTEPIPAEDRDDTARPSRRERLRTWLTHIFLGPDPARQLNLKITLSGQPGYLVMLLLIWYFTSNGMMDPALGWPVTLATLFSMLAFYVIIRFGWSRHLRDPAMTVPQMMNAAVFTAVAYVVAPEVHIAMLMPVAVTLAYSVFALKGRAVMFIRAFTMVLLCMTSAVMCVLDPQHYKPHIEILVMAILGSTVVMLTWSGTLVVELRARQRRQREELGVMLDKIEHVATHDALTGLFNRRQMNALLLQSEWEVSRYGGQLSVAVIDLDRFKQVNDTHGHAVGDEVLQTFAAAAAEALRGADLIARWGGEEFLLLSPASPQAVKGWLDALQDKLAVLPASTQVPGLRVGFSAGIAPYVRGEPMTLTVHRADEALYEAKHAGRARCTISHDVPQDSVGAEARDVARRAMPPPLVRALATATASSTSVDGPEKPDDAEPDVQAEVPSDGGTPQTIGSAVLGWLLGTQPRQRRWLSRTLVAYVPYVVGLLTILYCTRQGLMDDQVATYMAWIVGVTPVVLYLVVRLGLTRHFKDPALTLVHMLLATTGSFAMYATTNAAASAQLMTLVMLLTVAVVNLKQKEAWIVCLYAMLGMTVLIPLMCVMQPDFYQPRHRLTDWLLVNVHLPVVMLMGSHLDKLRERLREQRAQLKQAVIRLGELATRDELTGLHNRAHMNEMLKHYAKRHEQCQESFSLALIDLDHFKRLNDQHGHNVGDEVLKTFARQAVEILRETDLVARWGGEEFLVLWPRTPTNQALVALDRLRETFIQITVSPGKPELRASFSAGVAASVSGEAVEGALARADEALYAAKRMGRNRTLVHGEYPATAEASPEVNAAPDKAPVASDKAISMPL